MTIQELYAEIGGSYEQAVKVMRMDKLIDKHIRRFKTSGVYEAVAEAGKEMDTDKLFESTHAMKGMCANLGLMELSDLASDITENYRPGGGGTLTDDEVKEKLDQITVIYQKTVDGISRYEAEA